MKASHGSEFKLAEHPALKILQQEHRYEFLDPKDHPEFRDGDNNVLLRPILIEALQRINGIDEDTATSCYGDLLRITDNQAWHKALVNDSQLNSRTVPGEAKKTDIHYIDFKNPKNNVFTVTNQFYVKSEKSRIPDVVVFINGIPIVVVELKSPLSAKDKMGEAFDQIKQYEEQIPRLFFSNCFNIVSDGISFLYGATGSPSKYWGVWRDPWPKIEEDFKGDSLKQGLYTLLEPTRLLDLIAHFIVFEKDKESEKIVKKICRYQQFRAVNKIYDRIKGEEGKSKGLVWHTQGSGKSLTMVYTALKLKRHFEPDGDKLENLNLLVLTDRTDLDNQISATFEACGVRNPTHIGSISELHEQIRGQDAHGLTLLSTIFKFQGSSKAIKDSDRWVLLVDECHRTQEKDLGAFLRATFPDAQFYGFTGTPIKIGDKDTYTTFGVEGETYLDKYGIDDAVRDGATVPIHYTSRKTDWHIDEGKINVLFDQWFAEYADDTIEKIKKRGVQISDLAKHPNRIELICFDIWEHFKASAKPDGMKAQIVAYDRETVILYKRALNKVISEDLVKKGMSEADALKAADQMSACVYSSNQEDGKPSEDAHVQALREDLRKYYLDDVAETETKKLFKKEGHDPQFLIVCNKLLTGFDAPIESVMYLDNPLKEHNLLQAIARTNRQWTDKKKNGLIVDYIGVSKNLDTALSTYRKEDVQNAMRDLSVLASELKEAHAVLDEIMKGIDRSKQKDIREEYMALIQAIGSEDAWYSFKKKARDFISAYTALSPEPEVLNYRKDLMWVSNFVRYATQHFEKKESLDHLHYSEKIREMLEEHLEVTGLRTICKLRHLTDPDFWTDFKAEGSEVDVKTAAVRKSTEMKKITSEKVFDNPLRYGPFADRVMDAIRRFEKGQVDAAELLNEMEDIAKSLDNEQNAYKKSGLSEKGYDIYKILEKFRAELEEQGDGQEPSKKTSSELDDKTRNTLAELAREIEELYNSDNEAPPGWHLRTALRKELRQKVRRMVHPANLRNWKDVPAHVEEYALKTFIKS